SRVEGFQFAICCSRVDVGDAAISAVTLRDGVENHRVVTAVRRRVDDDRPLDADPCVQRFERRQRCFGRRVRPRLRIWITIDGAEDVAVRIAGKCRRPERRHACERIGARNIRHNARRLDCWKFSHEMLGILDRSICASLVRLPGRRRQTMRVIVFVKASKESEAGQMPTTELLAEMGKYNEQLVKAGVMLAGEGLHPSTKGKRVKFSGSQRTVIDGPFAETKELIAGFWIWKVRSMDEAVEWLKKAPFDGGTEIEIRPIFEAEDFGRELTPELRERASRLRAEVAARQSPTR